MESEMVEPPPPKRRGRKRKIIDVQDVTVDSEGKKGLQTRSLKLVGRYVLKEFQGSGLFLGKIVSYASGLYRIRYEDGDCEDLNSGELRSCLVEDDDLIVNWSERKETLDNLLCEDVTPRVLKVENVVTKCANQVDLSFPVELRNDEAGSLEVEEVHTVADADSSSDSCEKTRDEESVLDMDVPLVPPPELPPSSGHIGVPEEYVSHLLSVYSFLRSFSVQLFLHPFGLDDLVGALNCSVANTLLDSVHVALMHVLKRHFERLSSEGLERALKCLRCLDWNLLDALTWPVYVVHYLLVMSYTVGPDWKDFHTHSLERDYYTLSPGRKLKVLQILCDDALDSEELRAEMDVREESEVGIDVDRSAVFASTGVPKRVHPRYSKSTTCIERLVTQGSTVHHEIQSFLSPSMRSQVAEPVGSSADKDGNGDECRLCGMDGFLLCCDGCPESYHSRCLGLNKMHITEGSWYCHECKINATEPKISCGTDLRGGNVCGIDPYEQVFVATCDHLLVLNASIDSWTCLRYYSRLDIPRVLHALCSKAEHVNLYSEICREIIHFWELPGNILPHFQVSETALQLADGESSGECTGQSLNLLHKSVQDMIVIDNVESCTNGISSADMADSNHMNCVQKPVLCDNVSYAPKYDRPETTDLTLFGSLNVQPADPCEFSQQSTSSVTETFKLTTNTCNGSAIGNSLIGVPCTRRELDNGVGRNMCGGQHGGCLYMGSSFNPTNYINYYLHGDFSASAAANLAILSSEENQVPESRHLYNRRKGLSDSVSLQLKAFSMAAIRFFWPNTEKKLVEVPRERCSWCFSCKASVSSRRGCLLNAAVSNSIKGAIKVLSGVRPMNNVDGRLPGIATYILFMEESLRGLLVGPFLNDAFRMRWRKQAERASTCNAIKISLLELEENIRQIALSEDWMKLYDGISSQPSTSQVTVSVTGSTQKRRPGRPGRRGRKPSIVVDVAVDSCQDDPSDFTWWRGGSLSKLVLQRGFLPRSVIRKAARQGYSKKIPGIYYLEGQETPKRTRQLVWRSAVEMSRSTAQLAHQVRCLDFHVRWSDLVRPEQVAYDGKSLETEASAFRNAFVSDKKIVEHEIRYCVAFGNQKHLPSRVMKNIAEIDQMANDGKERYWFSETRIPLYLIKEYEEKTEKDKPVDELSKLQRKQLKAFHKNIFAYLSLKQDNMERDYCCSCNLDLLYRNAVQCNACQGFCHDQCASSSTVNVNGEVQFFLTCKRCCETQVGTQVESSNGSPTSPLLLHGQDIRKAGTAKKGGQLAGYKESSASVRTVEHSSEVKSVTRSSVAKKSKIKNWGLIWGKKNCEVASSNFRQKNILFRGNPHLNLIQPSCRLCSQPCNSDLIYIRCETCEFWFHADALELDESKIFSLIGFKCCKCRRIRSPVCPYMDTEKKKALEEKLEHKQPSKQEISEMVSDSGLIAEQYKEDLPAYSTIPTKIESSHLTADELLLFSHSEVEQLAEDKSEVEPGWNNASVSLAGPQKLPVRRHVQQENQVDYPCPEDPFQVRSNLANSTEKRPFRRRVTQAQANNLDCNSSTCSFQFEASDNLEANGVSYMQESLPPQVEWVVSNDNFDDGITLDYDSLGCDDMDFEPQTYFSFNELLASDDVGHTNGHESLENATGNWGRSSLPENGLLEISYDQEEPTLAIEALHHLVPCKICSHTEPYPDLSCQVCGMWIHSHCSPWVESSSWENGWKCGHCREWR